jgi:hypothetical protein
MSTDLDAAWEKIKADEVVFETEVSKVGLYHRGWRFWPPYVCCLCGTAISASQWAFARNCGPCDVDRPVRQQGRRGTFYVGGKVELENKQDRYFIDPEFTPPPCTPNTKS